MKIFKKNQLAILVISLMLITAGYLNYGIGYNSKSMDTSTELENNVDLASLGDAELVNANTLVDNKEDTANLENSNQNENLQNNNQNTENNAQSFDNQAKETNSNPASNYFTSSKLERNVMYSQMIERYQEIINSSSQSAEQKAIAQEEINKINEIQNAIMISENLLTSKGFNDNIIFVNGDSISVIIGKEELKPEEIAQIQNILSRELHSEVENIHISVK